MEHINEIYNHLTGHDGADKNEVGDTVIEAVWNMEPHDFLESDSKHGYYWKQSYRAALPQVKKYMKTYYNYAKTHDLRAYDRRTELDVECW